MFPQPKLAEWLPAPPMRVYTPQRRPAAHDGCPVRSIWIAPEGEPLLEKAFMAALAGGAVVGIFYGLSLVINLIEHWAVFQATISHALQ